MAKRKLMTTPKGKAFYPHVNEPDKKFDALGKYTCDILVDADEMGDFQARCADMYEEEYAKVCAELKEKGKKKMPKKADLPIEPSEEDEATFLLKCRRPAKVISKRDGKEYTFDVKLFDAKGQPTTASLGSGSVVKCSVEPYFWTSSALGFGMSLRLQAVQVLELVEYQGGNNAGSFGFAEEDGSFTSEGEDFNESFQDDDSNGDF